MHAASVRAFVLEVNGGLTVEVHMTDVLAPMFIPYARFLEVRARRLDIVIELTQPNGQRADNGTVSSSGPIANNERARVAVRVLAANPAAGVQHS